MSSTLRLRMPLLDAAQAQKHVTINEALTRADVLAAKRVETRGLSTPPSAPLDGTAYIVGPSASDDWGGHEDAVALSLNGGWDFVPPWAGARFWVQDEAVEALFVDGAWVESSIATSNNAASTLAKVIEFDHVLSTGTASTTLAIIPDKAIVLGVTGRVIDDITGPTSWLLGVSGSHDRYGSGIGVTSGSFVQGVTGQPLAYFGASSLQVTSDGAAFASGTIRLAVHFLSLSPPHAV